MTLAIEGLSARRGKFLVGPVTVSLEPGDCLALMGANGAGKTTLLETLAGFCPAVAGRLLLEGEDITDRVPDRRRIAYLPQDLALFPHLDVTRNVAFGARYHRSRRTAHDTVAALIEEFGLKAIRDSYPDQLSRGQAQRVAFARAVATDPAVLLMDEPMTSLDLSGRRSFTTHVRKLLVEHKLTVVHATHDVMDSLSLASHLIVLDGGETVQAGTPAELLRNPADVRVAELLGITNLWPAEVVDNDGSGIAIRLAGRIFKSTRMPVPRMPLCIAIGPGEVEVFPAPPPGGSNVLEAVIRAVQRGGQALLLELDGGLEGLRAAVSPGRADDFAVGQTVWVRLPADRLRLVPAR